MTSIYDQETQLAARMARRRPRRGNPMASLRPSTDCQRTFLVRGKRTPYLRERRLFSRSTWSGDRPRLDYFKSKAMSPEMAATKKSAPTKKDGRADRTAVDG
jgi:hypothetical protein